MIIYTYIYFCLFEWQKRWYKTSPGIFGQSVWVASGATWCRLFLFASSKDSTKNVMKSILPWYARFAGENDVVVPAKRNCQWLGYGNGNSQIFTDSVSRCRMPQEQQWLSGQKCPISYCARMSIRQFREVTADPGCERPVTLRYFEEFWDVPTLTYCHLAMSRTHYLILTINLLGVTLRKWWSMMKSR